MVLDTGAAVASFDYLLSVPRTSGVPHQHEQIGYVVPGEIDLVMEQIDTVRLGAGCSYYVAPNTQARHRDPHGYDPARLLYTCS